MKQSPIKILRAGVLPLAVCNLLVPEALAGLFGPKG